MSASPGSAAYLVKDIAERGGSTPTQFTKVGDRLFFVAADNRHGRELWRTDGTPAGTVLVRDIRKGPFDSDPGRLVAVGDLLFFRAEATRRSAPSCGRAMAPEEGRFSSRTSILGREVRCTTLLARSVNGRRSGTPCSSERTTGRQEARYGRATGTAAGTRLVKDIWPGHHESFPMMLTAFGNEVFFDAEDDEHGEELWKTDGSPDGTVLVKDINPGPDRSTPLQLTPAGNTLYFTANDGIDGFELWENRWLRARNPARP